MLHDGYKGNRFLAVSLRCYFVMSLTAILFRYLAILLYDMEAYEHHIVFLLLYYLCHYRPFCWQFAIQYSFPSFRVFLLTSIKKLIHLFQFLN